MFSVGWCGCRGWLQLGGMGMLFLSFFFMGGVWGQDLQGNQTRVFVIGIVAPGGIDGDYCRDAVDGYRMFIEHMHGMRENQANWMMMLSLAGPLPFDFSLRVFESVDELILGQKRDPVHFLVGCERWKSDIATGIARFAYANRVILLRCCAPEGLTQYDDVSFVFDMRPGSGRFIQLLIQSLQLRSMERFAVLYEGDGLYHSNACSAASKMIKDFQDVVEGFPAPYVAWYNKSVEGQGRLGQFFTKVAETVELRRVEVVVACFDEEDSELLVKAFDDIR